MTTTLDVQLRLLALGYDLGPRKADGIPGRMTAEALRQHQRRNGLPPTGVADPRTLAALFVDSPKAMSAAPLPWMEEARRLMGVREVAGKQHSGVIMGWAKRLGLWFPDDETPWCGLFVAHCIGATLPGEPLPANPLGARNWQSFGVRCKPQIGAVMAFSRPGAVWSGHVGFYVGETATAFRILGGNQSNAVTETLIARDRFLAARWPSTVALTDTGTKQVAGGALSSNEA